MYISLETFDNFLLRALGILKRLVEVASVEVALQSLELLGDFELFEILAGVANVVEFRQQLAVGNRDGVSAQELPLVVGQEFIYLAQLVGELLVLVLLGVAAIRGLEEEHELLKDVQLHLVRLRIFAAKVRLELLLQVGLDLWRVVDQNSITGSRVRMYQQR